MCEANAYLLKRDGALEMVMEAVDVLEPEGDSLRLQSIFGEQKVLKASIKAMRLVEHKIILEEKD